MLNFCQKCEFPGFVATKRFSDPCNIQMWNTSSSIRKKKKKKIFLFFQKTKFVCQTLFNMDCLGLKMIFFAIVLGCCCWHFFIGFSLLLLHIQCISIHVKSQTLIAYSFPILSIACFLVITIRYHIQMFRYLNSIHRGIQKHIAFLFLS